MTNQSATPANPRWKAPGVTPTQRRNAVVKWLWLAKPHSKATPYASRPERY